MPLYRVKCEVCLEEDDIFRSFQKYDELPECCGQKMTRVICPAMVSPDIQPYRSMINGEIINSRSRHREHLREHQCVEIGNETKYLKAEPTKPPPGLKETLIRVANDKLRS